MTDPVRLFRTYAEEEWDRITCDPLSVDDEPAVRCGVCGDPLEPGHDCPGPSRSRADVAVLAAMGASVLGLLVLVGVAIRYMGGAR